MEYFITLLFLSVTAIQADITGKNPSTGTCLCLTARGVNARDSAGLNSNVLASLSTGECYKYAGQTQTKDGHQWYYIQYTGKNLWVTGKYLDVASYSRCSSKTTSFGCDNNVFVTRAGWGARAPKGTSYLKSPVDMVFIHHTAGSSCTTNSRCQSVVRGVQNYHMDSRNWADIGYSFLVGEDGKVYEGRGWTRVGAHTYNYNSRALAFSMMGNFMTHLPSQTALNAVRKAIQCGVDRGYITRNYRLYGHRDAQGSATSCPGDKLYSLIKTWPHYSTTKP